MKKTNTKTLVLYALFTAIIVLMTFTPLGYLRVGGIEITFLSIPVAIGAIMLGPVAGAVLGGIFGLSSFLQCFGLSAFGSTLFNINPIFTFILCVIPRILMGYFSGLIFAQTKKRTDSILPFGLAAIAAPVLNTVLFVGGLILLFGQSDYIQDMQGGSSVLQFMVVFIGLNGLVEAAVGTVVGTAVSKAVYSFAKRRA